MLPIQPAVAVPDQLDRDGVNAGVTGLLASGERRQLAIVRAREDSADIGDFGGHQMEVIEQPLRHGRDTLSGPHIVGQRAIGAAHDAHVVVESRKDVPRTASRIRIDREARGERQGSFFEPFDADELVPQRFLSWRRDGGSRADDRPVSWVQERVRNRAGTRERAGERGGDNELPPNGTFMRDASALPGCPTHFEVRVGCNCNS